MGTIRVWTKQSAKVLEILETQGRYTAKRLYVRTRDENDGVLELYDWLAHFHPGKRWRPADADYPVWLSFSYEASMQITPDTVLLELEIPEEQITRIDVKKWTTMLNRGYLPKDEADYRRHRELLAAYGQSDAGAYESPFYPEIKREIEGSWIRLFEENGEEGHAYGTVWELKKEWLREVRREET